MAYTPVTEAERVANGWTYAQAAAEDDRRRMAEQSSSGSGFGIGDIFTLLFGGLLAAVGIGAAGTSGLFGPAIAAVFKSFINQILPPEWQFDNGEPMEAFLRGLDQTQAQELLQGDAPFGAGLGEETAVALSAEWTAVLDALEAAGVNLETLHTQGMEAIMAPGVLNHLVRSDLSLELKQTLFYEALIKQNISPELARELSNQTQALLQVVNDGTNGIDIEALLREGVEALSGQNVLAMLQSNPQLGRLLGALSPEVQAAILQAAGHENLTEVLNWLQQPSQSEGLSNMDVVMAAVGRMNLSEADMSAFEGLISQAGTAFASGDPAQLKTAIQSILASPLLQNDALLPELANALAQLSLPALSPEQLARMAESTGKTPEQVRQLMLDAQALIANPHNLTILRDLTVNVGPEVSNALIDVLMPAAGTTADLTSLLPLVTQHLDALAPLATLDLSAISDPQVKLMAEASLTNLRALIDFQTAAHLEPARLQRLVDTVSQTLATSENVNIMGVLTQVGPELGVIAREHPEAWAALVENLSIAPYLGENRALEPLVKGTLGLVNLMPAPTAAPLVTGTVTMDEQVLDAAGGMREVAVADMGALNEVPNLNGSLILRG